MDITPLNVQYEDVQEASGAVSGIMVTGTVSGATASAPRRTARESLDTQAALPSDSNLPVVMAGYLQKQGRRFHGWHQRWFEIQGHDMYYYKTKKKSQRLGAIDLSICKSVGPSRVATFGQSFEIQTTERLHILAVRSRNDMQKWIQCIKGNMGPREGSRPPKAVKHKKWDTFKNALSVAPQNHVRSMPQEVKKSVPLKRNQSFFDRFKQTKVRSRSKSPSSGSAGGEVYKRKSRSSERSLSPRPISLQSEDMPPSLYIPDVPVAMSLPATPLIQKKEDLETEKEVEAVVNISASNLPVKAPVTESHASSAMSNPEQQQVSAPPSDPPSKPSPNAHDVLTETETPAPTKATSPPRKGTPPPTESSSPQSKSPSRTRGNASIPELPEILMKKTIWDEIRETLETLPEGNEDFSYEELPAEKETWLEKDTPIEQLREFLAVCP